MILIPILAYALTETQREAMLCPDKPQAGQPPQLVFVPHRVAAAGCGHSRQPPLTPVPPFLSPRSASFSQGTRASFLMRSDTAVQKLAQGNGHCVNGVGGQVHGFYSLPKPSRHHAEFRDSAYDLPRSLAAHGHTKGSLTGSETDNEDAYTFKTPSSALCREFGDLLVDSVDVPATPLSAYQIPRTFTLDKNHNAMAVAAPGDSAIAPPPRPPKPGQADTPRWGSPQQRPPVGEGSRSVSAAATIPRRNTLPAMDNSRLHRGQYEPSLTQSRWAEGRGPRGLGIVRACAIQAKGA